MVLSLIGRGFLIGLVLCAVFMAGFFFRDGLGSTVTPSRVLAEPGNYPLLAEVHTLLEGNYLRDLPTQQEFEYAAIRGALNSLHDPYTFFVDPPVAQSESDVLAGHYGGIGVQVQHAADGSFVLYPFREGPAERAGIEDGDTLLQVDDLVITPRERIDVIDQAMRGEVGNGNGVVLRVLKRATNQEQTYTIAFEVIEVPSVIWRTLVEDARIGYVQIQRFTSRTPDELRAALQELRNAEIAAWIVDLRDNAGGLLQESIQAADEFLDEGVIVYERTRDSEHEYLAASGGLGVELPMAVLINHGTASAAELVAGALQAHERGILIGQATYGKGSVQLIFRLSDQSSVHITSAEWLTPNRAQLENNGLTPDIAMIPAEDGRDVEIGEAIRYLQEQIR